MGITWYKLIPKLTEFMKLAIAQGLANYSRGPNLACSLFLCSLQAKHGFYFKNNVQDIH